MRIKDVVLETYRKYLFVCLLLIAAIIASVSLQLIPPQLLRRIVDDNLSAGIYDGVVRLGWIYLAVLMASYLADFFKIILTTYLGQKMILGIRYSMSEKLTKLPMRYYDSNSVGDIMSRFTQDVEAVNTLLTDGLINIAVDLFKIVGIVYSIFTIDRTLFLYVLATLPILVWITMFFRKKVYSSQIMIRKLIGKMTAFIQEIFGGIKLFKIYAYEKRASDAFEPIINEQVSVRRRVNAITSSFSCITQVLRTLIICVIVVFATKEINLIAGITVGSLAATINLIGMIFSPIEQLAQEIQTIQQALAGLNRINGFLSETEERRGHEEKSPPQSSFIEVKGVCFGYDESKNVLENATLRITQGMKVALAGRTGSGKTTMLNLIAGLYMPAQGEISIGGYNPFTMPARERRRLIGIVPQIVNMFSGKIRDMITLGDDSITNEDIGEAVELVGLHETIMSLPDKIDTVIGEGEVNLSFGEMQLLTLARAIVTRPPLLLLDELTSGMDAVTEARILAAIKRISENRTIITISHRLSGIIDANYVYILSAGKIVEEGPPDDLVRQDGWYAKYKQLEEIGWGA